MLVPPRAHQHARGWKAKSSHDGHQGLAVCLFCAQSANKSGQADQGSHCNREWAAEQGRESDQPATGAAGGAAALTANNEFSLRHLVRQIVCEDIAKKNARYTMLSQALPQQELPPSLKSFATNFDKH